MDVPLDPGALGHHRKHSSIIVYRDASAAMSAGVFPAILLSRTYGTSLAFKNDRNVPKLTAKFTFCGMSPMTSAIFNALSLPTTTPTFRALKLTGSGSDHVIRASTARLVNVLISLIRSLRRIPKKG